MCGIAGIFSHTNPPDPDVMGLMLDSIKHRGPDHQGIWKNEAGNLVLGHRRLSIIDITPAGHQPLQYKNRYSITFNGEIYNYPELKSDLKKKGYDFNSNTDTEVLLALYDDRKEKALDLLDGMFAFAIWDEKEKKLFCARDRFGEKPFYFTQHKGQLIFASEIKAILKCGIKPILNRKLTYLYFLYNVLEGYNNSNETFFQDIFSLQPGHYFYADAKGLTPPLPYWDIQPTIFSHRTDEQFAEELLHLLSISIKRRLRSDVDVGSSFSGGIDSTSIVMLVEQLKNNSIRQKTFSARFPGFAKDESRFMDKVIQQSKIEPISIFPDGNAIIEQIETLGYHHEQPVSTGSVAVQYEVMRAAKKHNVKVLLDGQGADETLGGYKQYWKVYLSQLYRVNRKQYHEEVEKYRQLHNTLPHLNNFDFKWNSLHKSSYGKISPLKKRMVSSQSTFFLGIHPALVCDFRTLENPLQKFSNLKEQLYYATRSTGLGTLLHHADRNAMAHSVEVRLPFLYHELVNFIFSLPDSQLMQNGWTKFILRNAVKNTIPSEICWRKDKIGYEPPQSDWMNNPKFQEYLTAAIQFLKEKEIIGNSGASVDGWNYIGIYAFCKAFNL